MIYRDRHVVVTGGTGALGIAVVGALLRAGAQVHVSYIHPAEAERFPLRGESGLHLVGLIDLTNEADIARLYGGVPKLWASVHLAGGFAAADIVETDKAALMRQIDMNLVSCFLCCRAAAKAMRDAAQVTDAVAVCIGERARIHLIDDC